MQKKIAPILASAPSAASLSSVIPATSADASASIDRPRGSRRLAARLGSLSVPVAALLLAACSSQPTMESAESKQETAALNSGWQAERAKYMDCVQDKADDGVKGKAAPKDVAANALESCKGQLGVMHDAFQSYLSAQMSSSHGQAGARQAAARVTTDTREKARTYLTRYVEVERYKANQR